MKKLILGTVSVCAILIGYLGFAPVPIDPGTWEAPINAGHVGAFEPNNDLASLERISVGKSVGPEDAAVLNGMIYATSQTGDITQIDPSTKDVEIIANTGGVPLGIEENNGVLYIADAHKGLLSLTKNGELKTLTDEVDGTPIRYADDLDIADNGVIYFSDASTKFGAEDNGTTMAASLLEIMEGQGTGRVLAYDPRTRQTRTIAKGLVFPNGVAMHPDGSVLVNETGRYRVLKIDPETGRMTDWVANLPGFPDNINPGPNGTYFLGLISPRSEWLDANASKPGMRKLAMRLPPSMRPKAEHYGHIVQLDANGNVLRTFQDSAGEYHDATGALVHDGYLYVTSLHETDLARRPYPALK
ncbi:MAG: SMP-30/gluconolactonase/LRE family protein [Litorimonas sp.]